MKKCKVCGLLKESEMFELDRCMKSGRRNQCKACRYEYMKIFSLNHPEVRKKTYQKNRTKIIKNVNIWTKNRDKGLHSKYWSMRRRCKYPGQHNYKHYGGKGIKVEWNSYIDFKRDMYESYLIHLELFGKKQTTLDRIDSDKNYCKENCRWATWEVQSNNRIFKKLIN